MNRFAWPLVVFGLLVIVFGVALKRAPEKQFVHSALIGRPAPAFTLPDLRQPGQQVTSDQFKGQWYLLNVWGTWCVECRVEHPVLLDIKQQGKVQLVGLNYKDDPDQARAWLAELGNPFSAIAEDREGRVAIDWGVYGAPESFLVDPQGVIVEKIVGVITHENWNAKLLPLVEGRQP